MSIYIQLLLLAWVTVFVVDLSGVVTSFGEWMGRPLRRPLSCSRCMTWWLGLLWAVCTRSLTWAVVGYIAALAYLTPVLMSAAVAVSDLLLGIISKLKFPTNKQ